MNKYLNLKILARCTGGFLLLAAVVLFFHVGQMFLQSYQAKSWPTVEGKIISINEYEDLSTATRKHGSTQNCLTYKYQYEVAGHSYVNDRTYIGDRKCIGFSTLRSDSMMHGEGDKITVYYLPADPSIAILMPGKMNDWAELAFVLGLLVFARMFWGGNNDMVDFED